MDYILSDKSTDLTKYIYNIEWNYTKQHSFGGVPERLIGAVLKTVERASVPWVRIPPPPNKEQIGLSICFLFCVGYVHLENPTNRKVCCSLTSSTVLSV